MTKDLLKRYRYLGEVIRKDEEKLKFYKQNPPAAYVGRVQTSNKEFPFQRTAMEVSGCEVRDRRLWREKQDEVIGGVVREGGGMEGAGVGVDIFLATVY